MSGFSYGTDKSTDSIRIYPLEANHTLHDAGRNKSVVKFANDVNAVNNAHGVKTKRNSVAAFPPILKSDDDNQKASDSEKPEDEEEADAGGSSIFLFVWGWDEAYEADKADEVSFCILHEYAG